MPEPETPIAGERLLFGKYELGKLLGCGAFAKVYHARNVATGQSVAVKLINKKKTISASLMSSIKREISIMHRLNHPNIVKLYEVLATRSKIYFVMEFVKGGELFGKIAKGKFSEDMSRKYFHQLISAISYCHSHGVFHRDLKPENLLVDDNGDLKVSDFGLSAVTGSGQTRSDGLLHTLCGTPAYVAPEILSRRGYDGAKVDVWSCGVILFVLTTGYLPFNDPNLMVMYKKIYRGEYRCPKSMSKDLKRFLSRLLDINPETRTTVDEIIHDPWFRKGNPEFNLNNYIDDQCPMKIEKNLDCCDYCLNAFDLISFSSGLDLSGLFDDSVDSDVEQITSSLSPQRIITNFDDFAKKMGLRMRNKDFYAVLEKSNGDTAIEIEIYRITDELVIVQTKYRGCDSKFWKNAMNDMIRSEAFCSSSHQDTQVNEQI